MERPPTSRDSGEHVLGLGTDSAEPPRPPRRRRDSGDRISFDSIARLVQPSMPPRSYDTLTPVAKSDLRPPALPEATGAKSASPRRRGLALGLKVVAALVAVALGAGLSHALRGEPAAASSEQVVAGAAITPGSGAEEATGRATASDEVVRLDEQVLPATPQTTQEQVEAPAADDQPDRGDEQRRREAAARSDDDAPGTRERAGDRGAEATASAATGTEADIDPTATDPTATGEASEDGAEEPSSPGDGEQAESQAEATAEPAEEEAPAAELPLHPTREDVQRTMVGALSAIRECAAGQNGTVQVEVTAGSSGRVRNAVITGAFAGTPEGSCMARAMRGVRFPRFTQESFSVRYPFQI